MNLDNLTSILPFIIKFNMRFFAITTLSALAALGAAAVALPRELEARNDCPNGLGCGDWYCCTCGGEYGCRPKGGVSLIISGYMVIKCFVILI